MTFAIAGFFLGFFVLFSTDVFIGYNISLSYLDPSTSLFQYLREYSSNLWDILLKGLALGFTLAAILGFGGFIIDFVRRDGGQYGVS